MKMKISAAIDHLLELKYRLGRLPDNDIGDLLALDAALVALREKQQRDNPEALTLEQLREMDDQRVYVKFDGLGMYALVCCFEADTGEYGVWLTNSMGGRNTHQSVIEQGGKIYAHKPRTEDKPNE